MEKKEKQSYLELVLFLLVLLIVLYAFVDSSSLKKPYHFDEYKYLEMSSKIQFEDIIRNFNPLSLSHSPLMQIITKISFLLFNSPLLIFLVNIFLRIISVILLFKVIDSNSSKDLLLLKLIIIFDPLQNYYAISFLKESQVSFGIILFFYSFYFRNYKMLIFSIFIVMLSRNVFTPFLILFIFLDFFIRDKYVNNKTFFLLLIILGLMVTFLLKDQIISFLIFRNEIMYNEGTVFFDNVPKHKIFVENLYKSLLLITSEIFLLPNILYANSFKEIFYSISILSFIIPIIYYLLIYRSINLNLVFFIFLLIIIMIILTTPYYSSEVRYKDIVLKVLLLNICLNRYVEK